MRKLAIFLFVIFWASWPPTVFGEEKFNEVQDRRGARPYFTVDKKGIPWLGYRGVDDVLYVINGKEGSQGKIRVEGVMGSSAWLDFVDDEVLAFWRGKVSADGRKYMYVNRAHRETLDFGNATAINTASDVLLPVEVVRMNNQVLVTWADERTKPNTFYMNRSLDGGRTFQPENMCLAPGFATSRSSLIADQGGYSFVFFGRNEADKETGIFYRGSSDGWNWGEITKVASVKDWAPFTVKAVATGNGPIVVWGGVKGLFYAYQDAKGRWHDSIIGATEGMDINRLQVAKDSKKNLFLVASYVKWQEHIQKPNVFLFKSVDGGITWQEPVKINHNAFDNTSAKFPALFVTEKDSVVVVWEDHRLIRGNIYMNYSLDGGKTWLPEDINLDDEPGQHNDFYPFISGHDNKVQVLWPRYPDDKLYGPTDFYFKEVMIP